jgi:transcriptional regulator with XRE-family HTH domain
MGRGSAFGQRLAELRTERGLSLRQLGVLVHYSSSHLHDLEHGAKLPTLASAAKLDDALDGGGQLAALATVTTQAAQVVESPRRQLELLRRQVANAVTANGLSPAAVDDWEQTALEHGRATRWRAPGVLLTDLTADFADLLELLQRRQSSSVLRRLTRVTAQMAGLMFLTLIKLDERDAARTWARTARIAAGEAGDRALSSWVRAQEAFVHYYCGHDDEALTVARHAQDLAGAAPCVGAVLAAALEARALGRMRRAGEAKAAIGTAETVLANLDAESLTESAFGYNEAQLRFHEGNALTHLQTTDPAWRAQQRALELYPASDYLDRALVRLDRASCLAYDGDASGAMAAASAALAPLAGEQRQGMLAARGHEVLQALPVKARALPASAEFRDLLMVTTTSEGADR